MKSMQRVSNQGVAFEAINSFVFNHVINYYIFQDC